LVKQNEIRNGEQSASPAEKSTGSDSASTSKKLFVEPEISVPVDVLEATTFFQLASSGATN
jgi:hypothetical protein